MSTIQNTTEETKILHLRKWGWDVALKKHGESVSLQVSTSQKKGYSFEIDDAGNVTEYISGDYVRVVMGDVIEKTGKNNVSDSEGVNIIRSGNNYVALTAPKVHLNPPELKGELTAEIPAKLKEY